MGMYAKNNDFFVVSAIVDGQFNHIAIRDRVCVVHLEHVLNNLCGISG